MRTAFVRFEPAGWEIEIRPATSENEAYAARIKELAAPYHLALEYDKLTDKRANRIVAQALSETVIVGSSNSDLPCTHEAWCLWLLEHEAEMVVLLNMAMMPDSWQELAGGNDHAHQP